MKCDKCGAEHQPIKVMIPKPEILSELNFDKLKRMMQDYIDYVASDKYFPDNDWKQYIYEKTITTFFGEDIFTYINRMEE